MEALRGEDPVRFGDDSAEENYQSASDSSPGNTAGVGSVVDSVKSTVKSAGEMLSEVSLGLESQQYLDKEVPSSDEIRQDGKKADLGTQEAYLSSKEIQAKEQAISGLGAPDDWSVVDPVPEAQSVVSGNGRKEEKQQSHQADSASYGASLTAGTKARKNSAEESTSGSLPSRVVAAPEIPTSAAEMPPSVIRTSAAYPKVPEKQELDDSQMSSVGAPSLDSSSHPVPLSYSEIPMSLRRRNRLSKMSEGGSDSMEAGIAGSYSPVSPVHVSPRSHKKDSPWAWRDWPKENRDESDNRSDTRVGTAQPKAAENLKAKGQLQGAESETATIDSSLERSEIVNEDPSEQKRKRMYPSGYDTDDEDEATSGLSRLERRSASRGVKQEEENAGSTNDPDVEGLTSGRSPRREVYTIPDTDAELEQGGRSTQLLFWPAELLVQAVGFQVKLIIQVVTFSLWMFNFAWSLVTRPIQQTMLVKERATDMAVGAVNQGFGLISQVTEGAAQTGPLVSKLSKKTIMGCLGSVYVIFVLGLLLIPAFFVDLLVVSRMVEEPVQLREILDFDYTQIRPSATVPILSGEQLEKAKTLPVEKLVSYRKIPAGHNFRISVVLTMPESEYNIRLGMFQVTAEMVSARNQVLMRQSKACMLPYRSPPIRLLKTILYSIPLLLRFSAEAETLHVTVLQAQEKMVPTASVRILLEPKALGGGLPELYEAELHLESDLPWPKAIIRRWKWTFYVWNGVCLFLFEVALILCCCRQVLMPGLGGDKSDMEENIVTGEVKKSSGEDINISKSKSKRRVYFEDDIPGAAGTGASEGSPLRGSRSEDVDHLSNNSDDSDVDAGWSIPRLDEAVTSVEEGVRAMEETVKTLGESLVEGVSEGLGRAFANVDEK